VQNLQVTCGKFSLPSDNPRCDHSNHHGLHVALSDCCNMAGCCVKCGSLKDGNKREEFMEEISEEYEEIREEHYDSLKVKKITDIHESSI